MIITFWKGVFVADHKPEDLRLLKKAGFELHEPTTCNDPTRCRACRARIGRRYYSARVEHATRLKRFCNPRALEVMRNHLAKLATSRAIDSNIVIPAPAGLSYLPFQKAGIAYAIQRKDTLFADDMGLGKSVESLGFLNYTKAKNVLIICPATLILNWVAEARKWLIDPPRIFIPRGGEDEVPELDPGGSLFCITNYEKVTGRSRAVKDSEGRDVKKWEETPLSRSLHQKWDVGIFDESQYLKNPDARRTRVILCQKGIYESCRRALFLTGTPMENRPIEIWPVAAALCPSRFGDWWEFARRYCALHEEQRGKKKVWVANGSSNHSELQQRLRTSIMIRRRKEDVLKELPPKRRQLIVLDDDEVEWSKYPEFLRWKDAYQRKFDEAMARLEAARTQAEYIAAVKELDTISLLFTEISDFRHKSGLLKLPACLKCADEILPSVDSLVIFAHHRDILEKIHEHYEEDSCVIYGDIPQKDRIPIVNQFQEGKKKIFIGGLKAAGTGITLTRANTVIFFEGDWNPATMKQAEDRLARIGQKKMVHVIHPVLNGSVDANMTKMTVLKQSVIDRMLDELPEGLRLESTRIQTGTAYEDAP
jgi:SWI/SNF-related matrix-associated actin-dependent regulator 1 of chromatin subfamily A